MGEERTAAVGWAKARRASPPRGQNRVRAVPTRRRYREAILPTLLETALLLSAPTVVRALAPRGAPLCGERAQDSTNNLVRVRGATSCPHSNSLPASGGGSRPSLRLALMRFTRTNGAMSLRLLRPVTRALDPRVHHSSQELFSKRMDCRGISAFTRVFRRAMPGNDAAERDPAHQPADEIGGDHEQQRSCGNACHGRSASCPQAA